MPSEPDVGAALPVLKKCLALREVVAAVSVVLSDLRFGVVARWLAVEFVHRTKGLQHEPIRLGSFLESYLFTRVSFNDGEYTKGSCQEMTPLFLVSHF